MKRKKRHSGEGILDVFRTAFSEAMLPLQPMIHINCSGALELENVGSILEYSGERIVFRLGAYKVSVQGEELHIVALNRHITVIRGRIFRVDLLEVER